MASTDKFSKVLSGTTRPVATTLSAQKLDGATSFTVVATTGWETSTPVHGIMYRTDAQGNKVAGSQIDWKGDVSGTTVSNVVITAGDDDTYDIGDTVELSPTAAWGDDMATGILVHADQDGTLKAGAVDETAVLADGVITNAKMATAVKPVTIQGETAFDYVASGCVWSGDSYGSTRAASMTSGVVYINGARLTVAAVSARTFTASRDTYIDLSDNGDGTAAITYTEVTNNNASPALAANSVRIGIIVTGASSIANVGSVNQGETDKVLPIASSIPYNVTDSLGNLICPRDPQRKILGYKEASASQGGVTAEVDSTYLVVPVIVPTGRKIKITATMLIGASAADTYATVSIKESTTYIQNRKSAGPGPGYELFEVSRVISPTAGSHTYKVSFQRAAGTGNVQMESATPAANALGRPTLLVELV